MPENLHTDAQLIQRLEEAAKHEMSAAEIRDQRVSFVFGNLPHNAGVTKHQVSQILARLEGEAA